MDNRKNTILLTVIAVATLLVAVIGATFAYFTAQGGQAVTRNVTVKTETADNTMFYIDSAISLTANQTNFYEGAGDLSSNDGTPVIGTAIFTASTGAANKQCYTLALNVTENDFIYTTDPNTDTTSTAPEMTLTVTRATVENVNDPANIVYGTPVTVINAMDITTFDSTLYVPETAQTNINNLTSYQIACDLTRTNVHELSATAGKTTAHKYTALITLKNKDYDQQEITDKEFRGNLTFTSIACGTSTVANCS